MRQKNKQTDGSLRKKWSQKGASEEPFWKTAPFCKEEPFFSKKSPPCISTDVLKKRSQNSATKGSVLQTKTVLLFRRFGSSFFLSAMTVWQQIDSLMGEPPVLAHNNVYGLFFTESYLFRRRNSLQKYTVTVKNICAFHAPPNPDSDAFLAQRNLDSGACSFYSEQSQP